MTAAASKFYRRPWCQGRRDEPTHSVQSWFWRVQRVEPTAGHASRLDAEVEQRALVQSLRLGREHAARRQRGALREVPTNNSDRTASSGKFEGRR